MDIQEQSIDARYVAALFVREQELVAESKRLERRQAEVQTELDCVRAKVERIARAARRIGVLEQRPAVSVEQGVRREKTDVRIARLMDEQREGMFNVAELVATFDVGEGTIRAALVRLKKEGRIIAVSTGVYQSAHGVRTPMSRPRLLDPVFPEKVANELRDGLAGGLRGGA